MHNAVQRLATPGRLGGSLGGPGRIFSPVTLRQASGMLSSAREHVVTYYVRGRSLQPRQRQAFGSVDVLHRQGINCSNYTAIDVRKRKIGCCSCARFLFFAVVALSLAYSLAARSCQSVDENSKLRITSVAKVLKN